jgi:hypothetical protein
MGVTYISSETKTAKTGTITIPAACDYVIALVKGSTSPVVINGIAMRVKAQVAETEGVPAISVQILKLPLKAAAQPYAHQATSVTFVYVYNAVCTRPGVVQEFSDTGTASDDLVTSTDDLVLGIAAGTVEQVELIGDSSALTTVLDETLCREGYITPGDASMSMEGKSDTSSGYWYQPPRVWVEGTLIKEGYYTYEPVYHAGYWYVDPLFGQPGHDSEYIYQPPYYTYTPVWHEPEYSDGYWRYPDQVWVGTGEAGRVSIAAVSIASAMVGSTYTTRPIPFS